MEVYRRRICNGPYSSRLLPQVSAAKDERPLAGLARALAAVRDLGARGAIEFDLSRGGYRSCDRQQYAGCGHASPRDEWSAQSQPRSPKSFARGDALWPQTNHSDVDHDVST